MVCAMHSVIKRSVGIKLLKHHSHLFLLAGVHFQCGSEELEGWCIASLHPVLSEAEICGFATSSSHKHPTKKGHSPCLFYSVFPLSLSKLQVCG